METTGTRLSTVPKEGLVKLRTTIATLLDAFALTASTMDTKGTAANLYLNAVSKSGSLYLYSTNLASETATKIKPEIESMEDGEVLINPEKLAKGLGGLAKETPVTLSLIPSGNSLRVQAGNVKFSLAVSTGVRDLSDRMKAIPSKETPIATVPVTELVTFIKRSTFCIPNDQTGQRANLAALKLLASKDKEEGYATDGSIAVHIASTQRQGKGDGFENGLLIPEPALQALATITAKKRKGETVSIIMTEKKNKVFFKFADGTHFGSLVMATTYPNMKPVMEQKTTYAFTLPRKDFGLALSRATFFVASVSSKKILELEFGAENLSIKANGDDTLTDTIPITYTSEKPTESIRLGMNIDYLMHITNNSNSETITFNFTSNDKPLVITDKEGEDEEQINVKYVVMGVRLPK